ncbi:hypothetical protein B0H66DRAFT_467908, partial [Apodospora peruviana]
FLHTANSRGRLCCSRDQLTQVLSHYSVMPAVLDFCFEARNKEKPTTTAMFRFEDISHSPGGCNPRIQHAFNILAPEQQQYQSHPGDSADKSPTYQWQIRPTATYHSFDMADAKSVWLVIKGNKVIRDRVTSSGASLKLESADTKQKQANAKFAFSLAIHLLILEWCTENWSPYTDNLEQRVRKHADAIKLAPVEDLSKKPPRRIPRPVMLRSIPTGFSSYSRTSTGPRGTGPPQHIGVGGRIRSNLSRIASGLSGHSLRESVDDGVLSEKIDKDEEQLNKIFSFDDLQTIRHVTDETELASLTINENRRIVATLLERYTTLIRSYEDFRDKTDIEKSFFESSILNFCQQLSILQGDLDSHEARLQLLLRSLDRNEEMFKGILQYGNMRVGEHYAKTAEASAKTMEDMTASMHEIAAKTEQETNSMHFITIFTLVFLPATFVSTLFSSGIWNFDHSESDRMGDWETRVPALKLFFAICVPLMAVALSSWWVSYRLSKRQYRLSLTPELDFSFRAAFLLQLIVLPSAFSSHLRLLDRISHLRSGYRVGSCSCIIKTRTAVNMLGSLTARPRSTSHASASDISPTPWKDPQPILDFTTHVNELTHKYIGRDGNEEHKPYIPESALASYWTKLRVNEVCKAHTPHLTIKFDVVKKRCLRLFSILVYIDKVQYFEDFLEQKIWDGQLPIVPNNLPQTLKAPAYKDVLAELLQHQWLFCPLVLDYAMLTNLRLEPEHILPFYDVEKIKDGDATQVFKIKVNKECNNLEPDRKGDEPNDRVYVLKSYNHARDERSFKNEIKALTTLQQSRQSQREQWHIVGYYGSFIQNGTFNLILQFANGGNLLDYYRDFEPPKDPAQIRQFWKNLFKVLKGLHTVHQITPKTDDSGEYRGIHEDIKPDNIILNRESESPYDFCPLLADFGHSHVRVARSDSDEMGVDRQGNQTYAQIPTAADIFSMGCVISDAASWVVLGFAGREEYRNLRIKYGSECPNLEDEGHFDCFHDAVDRSGAVDEMHDRIIKKCHPEDTVTPQLLELVKTHMLLWDWKQRLSAKAIYERFVKIVADRNQDTPKLDDDITTDNAKSPAANPPDINGGFLSPGSPPSTELSPSPKLPPRPGPNPVSSPDSALLSLDSTASRKRFSYFASGGYGGGGGSGANTPADARSVRTDLSSLMEEAQAWRRNWKAYAQNNPDKHSVVKSLQTSLRTRDHIFFVDDSRTMKQHATEVEAALETLAYIVKPQKTSVGGWGNVSLAFGPSSDPKGKDKKQKSFYTENKETKNLRNHLGKRCFYDRINSTMEDVLSDLLESEIVPRLPQAAQDREVAPVDPNPISLVVFTDGIWGGTGVANPVRKLIELLRDRGIKRTQVMIQFIRFGQDENGARNLSCLAQLGVEQGYSIVDTTPINGNVCSMLIGSISSSHGHGHDNGGGGEAGEVSQRSGVATNGDHGAVEEGLDYQ